MNMDNFEKEIINSTKEFAAFNNIHFDELTQSMVLNAIRETKQKLNIHGVVRPASAMSEGGELLATEAQDTVAERGVCNYAHHNSDLKCFGYCTECKGETVRSSYDRQP